ncbi:hypothetical protein ACOMHN_002079 [Nucella lapillus]
MRNFNYATATKVGRPDVSAISKDEDYISFKFRRSVPKLPERNYIYSKENVKVDHPHNAGPRGATYSISNGGL